MAPDDERPQSVGTRLRHRIHEELREAVVELYETGDEPASTVADVWRRCERVRGLLHLLEPALGAGAVDELSLLDRATQLLAPVHDVHLAVDALDHLAPERAERFRASLLDRARALDAQLRPGCGTPEASASLLADIETHVDTWPLPQLDHDAVARAAAETFDRARAVVPDVDALREHTRDLVEQLRFLGDVPAALVQLCDVLDELDEVDALAAEADVQVPVTVAALVRARRDQLRERARALAGDAYGPRAQPVVGYAEVSPSRAGDSLSGRT